MFRNIRIRYMLPLVGACAAVLVVPAIALAGEVYHREAKQENRIFDGVQDSQVTPSEFHNLETRELSVNTQRLSDLQNDGGHLSPQDYANLNRRLDNISRSIYHDRHQS